ncbi:MAG: glycosyltransferase [Acidimicrobiales bacterium]|nr:glycosyltransferase [Acidimicrobiales bacterium]
MTVRRRIVVATADTLGPQMAGPGIRAWHLADALAAEHDVRLVTIGSCDLSDPRFEVSAVDEMGLRDALQWCEIFVLQGWIIAGRPWIAQADRILVCDIYDPMHLEQLEQGRDGGIEAWRAAVHGATAVLNEQLREGDFFMCASEKQRDLWLGQLAGVGRINPATYQEDGTLRRLIDVVPFGVADVPPVASRSAMRRVLPGVDASSRIILWGGGIYNWFDPLTLLHAVDRLRHRIPEVRLVFMGLKHPNPEIPQMQMAVDAQRLSAELGLTGTVVHFNEGWVPFDERQDHLLDADIGVSIHLDHVETEFSFRTRILDYLWAGLPVVATGGDSFGDLIERHGFGLVVPAGDVDALEAALAELLTDPTRCEQLGAASERLADEFRWSRVLGPLVEFCRAPRRSPDLVDKAQRDLVRNNLIVVTSTRTKLRNDLATFREILQEQGPGQVFVRAAQRIRRLITTDP